MSAPPPAAPTDPDSTGPTPSGPSAPTDPAVFAPVRSAVAAVGTLLLIGIPTDILPNPLFGREIPVRWWEYPVLAATVLLTAAWFGIRSARESGTASRVGSDRSERPALVTVGVFTAWFAVACPVCNKIVLLLLGTTGALGVWAPLQPWLAAVSLILLAGAVVYRWRARPCGDGACSVPTGDVGPLEAGAARPATDAAPNR